jgi:CBS domain-containing protein
MNVTAKELVGYKGQEVWSVGPESTVFEALELMAEKNIGAVLVTDGDRLVGIFSERDYARKVVLAGKSSKDTMVRELMSGNLITTSPDTTVKECLDLFTENRIRHLPIVDNGKLVGILTIGDAVKHMITHLEQTVRDLEKYITGGGYGG